MARTPWFDDSTDSPLIDDYAQELSHFLDALADGRVEAKELSVAEDRLVSLMKRVEPMLDDAQHEAVTRLLCEMSAYSVMQTLHEMQAARSHAKLRL